MTITRYKKFFDKYARDTRMALSDEAARLSFKTKHHEKYREFQAMRKISCGEMYTLQPFDGNRCIFVHVPKCAGVSVARALFGNLAGHHIGIMTYRLIFSRDEFKRYFKFAFVRNPWDRLVSSFFYLMSGGFNEGDKAWADENLSKYAGFHDFVMRGLHKENVLSWKHFRPQYKYLCGRDMVPRVDFIGRFENLEEDFSFVQKKLGKTASLPHENKTEGRQKDYRLYYTQEAKQKARDVYRQDVEIFHYGFDDLKTSRERRQKHALTL